MKFFRRTLIALAGSAALMAGTSALAAEVTLKLHQFLPAQAGIPKYIMEVWANTVAEASEGRIEVQSFPSMQLGGKPPELIDQVTDGAVDLTWTVVGYTPGRFPRAEVFELPFMMTNAEATSRAFWDIAEKYMIADEFKDVKVLAVWVHGPGLIHSSDPIVTPGDLNGVSFEKGCYTGQEIVARMHYKGKGLKRLHLVTFSSSDAISSGQLVNSEGKQLGVLTNVISLEDNLQKGFAVLKSDIVIGNDIFLDNAGEHIPVLIQSFAD